MNISNGMADSYMPCAAMAHSAKYLVSLLLLVSSKIYKIIDKYCLFGKMMNCAVVWGDVDIGVMHNSEKYNSMFFYYVSERNNLWEMLH